MLSSAATGRWIQLDQIAIRIAHEIGAIDQRPRVLDSLAAMTRSAVLRPFGTTSVIEPNSDEPDFTSPLRITMSVSSRTLPVRPSRYSTGSPCAGTFAATLRPRTSV